MQRPHNYAIVDEVDSILIDEARTPLIISGQGDKSTDLYEQADRFARTLKMIKRQGAGRQRGAATTVRRRLHRGRKGQAPLP